LEPSKVRVYCCNCLGWNWRHKNQSRIYWSWVIILSQIAYSNCQHFCSSKEGN
jgi:hypothetical protein